MANWFRPAPQPQQFIGTTMVVGGIGAFILKSLVVALPLSFVVGYIANWWGESTGYNKGWHAHGVKIAENTRKKNDGLADINSTVEKALQIAEDANEAAAARAVTTLEGFPMKQRQECALKCSIPKAARATLENIK